VSTELNPFDAQIGQNDAKCLILLVNPGLGKRANTKTVGKLGQLGQFSPAPKEVKL